MLDCFSFLWYLYCYISSTTTMSYGHLCWVEGIDQLSDWTVWLLQAHEFPFALKKYQTFTRSSLMICRTILVWRHLVNCLVGKIKTIKYKIFCFNVMHVRVKLSWFFVILRCPPHYGQYRISMVIWCEIAFQQSEIYYKFVPAEITRNISHVQLLLPNYISDFIDILWGNVLLCGVYHTYVSVTFWISKIIALGSASLLIM